MAEPLERVPAAPTRALPLLASSRTTDSPFAGEPLTVTVKLTACPGFEGLGPLSTSVVVVLVRIFSANDEDVLVIQSPVVSGVNTAVML